LIFQELDSQEMAATLPYATASEIVRSGNSVRLQKAFDERSINLDETDGNGRTLLLLAAEFGRSEMAAAFVTRGADLFAKGKRTQLVQKTGLKFLTCRVT